MYGYDAGMRSLYTGISAVVVLLWKVGSRSALASLDGALQHELAKQNDLKIPEAPPQAGPSEEIPLLEASHILVELKVGGD